MQVRVPADRFNSDGCTDACVDTTMFEPDQDYASQYSQRRGRYSRRRADVARVHRVDARGIWRQPTLPGLGDPEAAPVPPEELSWTFDCGGCWKVLARVQLLRIAVTGMDLT